LDLTKLNLISVVAALRELAMATRKKSTMTERLQRKERMLTREPPTMRSCVRERKSSTARRL
jgi:hypothetical protein